MGTQEDFGLMLKHIWCHPEKAIAITYTLSRRNNSMLSTSMVSKQELWGSV